MNNTVISNDYCENVCAQTLSSIKEKFNYEYSIKEKALEQHYKSLVQNVTNSIFGLTNNFDSFKMSIKNMTATIISAVESKSLENDIKRIDQTSVLLNSTKVRFIESSKNSQYDLQRAILNLTSYFQVIIFKIKYLKYKTWEVIVINKLITFCTEAIPFTKFLKFVCILFYFGN